jgi:type IV pilus assembly protein PilQ
MRENRAFIIFLVGFMMFIGSVFQFGAGPLWAGDPVKSDPQTPQAVNVGYLENIVLESPMPGKERVIISVSRLFGANVENQGGNAVLLKLENTFVPKGFIAPSGESLLQRNISRIVPSQEVIDGKQWAYVKIDLKEAVPHSVRQEGSNILIDFNVSSLAKKTNGVVQKPSASPSVPPAAMAEQKAQTPDIVATEAGKNYNGHKISLDFQDADIRSVFRLLAELANVNIVSGDDVKGNLSVQMKNVPWDQALDSILSIKGLAKRQSGNVITVMTIEKMKKDEAAQTSKPEYLRVVSINYNDANKVKTNIADVLGKGTTGSVNVDEHSNSLIIQTTTREEMNKLESAIEKIDKPIPQILIKANIVETTKDTARNLGIQWGGSYGSKAGNHDLYVNPGGSYDASTGYINPFTNGIGVSGSGFGVNFPAAAISGQTAGALSLVFGTIGGNILDLQLSALQSDGKLNILSSPSLTTLDNQKAYTENGEKIPYVTTENTGGAITRTVKYENAVLRLEITPHVIDGKNLKMKIMVQKDEVDTRSGRATADGNPYIVKKQTETNLIVQDGETIVISGMTKQTKSDTVNGIPWLKNIPVLGWLFKGEGKSEAMEEVLIFITPTIQKPQAVAGIQAGQ